MGVCAPCARLLPAGLVTQVLGGQAAASQLGLVEKLGSIHVALVLWACRPQKGWISKACTKVLEKSPGGQAMCSQVVFPAGSPLQDCTESRGSEA